MLIAGIALTRFSYNPSHKHKVLVRSLGSSLFARRYLGNRKRSQSERFLLLSFPPATEMFHFAGYRRPNKLGLFGFISPNGFPHSEIPGSKVARHLPRAYRSHATSFIASRSRGIHHLPLKLISIPSSILLFVYI